MSCSCFGQTSKITLCAFSCSIAKYIMWMTLSYIRFWSFICKSNELANVFYLLQVFLFGLISKVIPVQMNLLTTFWMFQQIWSRGSLEMLLTYKQVLLPQLILRFQAKNSHKVSNLRACVLLSTTTTADFSSISVKLIQI